jgi:hypothetical protein
MQHVDAPFTDRSLRMAAEGRRGMEVYSYICYTNQCNNPPSTIHHQHSCQTASQQKPGAAQRALQQIGCARSEIITVEAFIKQVSSRGGSPKRDPASLHTTRTRRRRHKHASSRKGTVGDFITSSWLTLLCCHALRCKSICRTQYP